MRILIAFLVLCSVCWADQPVRLMSEEESSQVVMERGIGSWTYDYALSKLGAPTRISRGDDIILATWERYFRGEIFDLIHMSFRKSDHIMVAVRYEMRQKR